MNAEIVLNTITDADASAMRWLRSTFLYVRTSKMMTQNKADAKLKGWFLMFDLWLEISTIIKLKSVVVETVLQKF